MGEYDVPKTGKIRLKGASKVKKDKKEKKKGKKAKRIKDEDRERLQKEVENGTVQESDEPQKESEQPEQPKEPKDKAYGAQIDTRTKAQKDFDERRRKKLEQEMKKGPKSFSERLNEYNEYLASLTDQNDMPKIATGQ